MTTLAKPKKNAPVLAARTEEIRKISVLSHVWHSEQYQSRAKVDDLIVAKYKRDFLAYGGWGGFPMPTACELPDGRLEIVAGFHRGAAYKRAINEAAKAGKTFDTEIAVRVIKGTETDAILASIEDNNLPDHTGAKLLDEDRRKAAMMLIRNEETRVYSDAEIGRRVGLALRTIIKVRMSLADSEGIPLPDKVMMFGSDGKPRDKRFAYKKSPPGVPRIMETRCAKSSTGVEYRTRINGKMIHLGVTEDRAVEKFERLVASRDVGRFPRSTQFSGWACRRRISPKAAECHTLIGGYIVGGVPVIATDCESVDSFFADVFRAICLRKAAGAATVFVACNKTGIPSGVSKAIRFVEDNLPGVRILDANEFVAHFGGTPIDDNGAGDSNDEQGAGDDDQ